MMGVTTEYGIREKDGQPGYEKIPGIGNDACAVMVGSARSPAW
jgi:hypothetical protein